MKETHTSLREVQATLLSFISADTILIGHGLETDLCALKVTFTSFFLTSFTPYFPFLTLLISQHLCVAILGKTTNLKTE